MPKQRWYHQHDPRFRAMVAAIPEGSQNILDVGAKPYPLVKYLSQDINNYHSIDLGDGGQTQIKKEGKEIIVYKCNIETDRWPLDTNSMDVIVMGAIMEHLFDPLSALKEARRVLDEEGCLILTTPNATRLVQRIRMLLGKNIYDGYSENIYHRHNHEWTIDELEEILPHAGFEIELRNFITLNRTGLYRLLQTLTSLRNNWTDQILIRAKPTNPTESGLSVYRDSLVEREG